MADLIVEGWSDQAISRKAGIPRRTVNRWRRRPGPSSRVLAQAAAPTKPTKPWRPSAPHAYSYLLGLYLGDGHVATHPTASPVLRIYLDAQYGQIAGEAARAIDQVADGPRVTSVRRREARTVVVQCSWRRWLEALPQHGPGKKHNRRIELEAWQREIADAHPQALLRGLIHSDGCRTTNRLSTRLPSGRLGVYEYPRYFFSNLSPEILGLFAHYCGALGIICTRSNERHLSVARRRSVALLDSFVGPKR